MPSATGKLRYGPRGHTVRRRSPWWLLISCDHDWYDLYAPLAEVEIAPRWVMAVDRSRADGRPRLAVLRPSLCVPAWHPHICVVRRESPQRHRDAWELAVRVGDLEDKVTHLTESARYLRRKARNIRETILCTGRKDRIRRMEREAEKAIRTAESRERKLPRVQDDLEAFRDRWRRLAQRDGIPMSFAPGSEVRFDFDPSPRANGKHWWFPVRCQTIRNLRKFYGLRPKVYPAPHLTFAVKEGLEGAEPYSRT